MVAQLGLKIFEDAFKGYEDQYVLIGGSATQLAMEESGQQFSRTTKDLDIVVIVDALTPEFDLT
jgi:formylmethanofuran dehydrogenase subunit E